MSEPVEVKAVSGQGIADEAHATIALMAGKAYVFGGKTTDGFDCSGFVSYVFKKLFPNNADSFFLTADGYAHSSLFEDTTARQPGHIVLFSTATGPATHIGIVYSADVWIGSQSSTGVAAVKFTNSYWSQKTMKYRRFKAISPSSVTQGARVTPQRMGQTLLA